MIRKTTKSKSKKEAGCVYYVTVTEVDESTLEPMTYKSGKEISFDYMGKLVKDSRKIEINGEIIPFKSRVILKAI